MHFKTSKISDFKVLDGIFLFFRCSNLAKHASAPSSWSILVYKEATSIVTKMECFGNGDFFSSSSFWRKCLESQIKLAQRPAWYFRKESKNSDIRRVQELMLETMGRKGGKLVNDLWILGRPLKVGIVGSSRCSERNLASFSVMVSCDLRYGYRSIS